MEKIKGLIESLSEEDFEKIKMVTDAMMMADWLLVKKAMEEDNDRELMLLVGEFLMKLFVSLSRGNYKKLAEGLCAFNNDCIDLARKANKIMKELEDGKKNWEDGTGLHRLDNKED